MHKLAEKFAALIFTVLGVLCSRHANDPEVALIMLGFAVASFTAAGIAIFLVFREPTSICPACGNQETTKANPHAFFQVLPSYKCCACEQIWEPTSPGWLLLVGGVVGIAAIMLGSLKYANGDWFGIFFIIHGNIAIGECSRRLAKRYR